MSTHTPGPWKIDMDCIVTDDGAREIGYVNPDANPNHMADKRLIAASPRMLEFIREYARLSLGTDVISEQARAILREIERSDVEGESNG